MSLDLGYSAPQNLYKIVDDAAAEKIRKYRDASHSLAFLPACMPTSDRIHGEFLSLLPTQAAPAKVCTIHAGSAGTSMHHCA